MKLFNFYCKFWVEKHSAEFLLLSGGNKIHGRESEAQAMSRVAIMMGVPAAKIILEDVSGRTWEQAREVSKLINDPLARIGIVTSGIHMKRSIKSFKKYFKNVIPFPSSSICKNYRWSLMDLAPSLKNLSSISMIAVEYIGIVWYTLQKRVV